MARDVPSGFPFLSRTTVALALTGAQHTRAIGGGAAIAAVVPTISGAAWVTQHCSVVVDPTDPFLEGYTVGDIWAS